MNWKLTEICVTDYPGGDFVWLDAKRTRRLVTAKPKIVKSS